MNIPVWSFNSETPYIIRVVGLWYVNNGHLEETFTCSVVSWEMFVLAEEWRWIRKLLRMISLDEIWGRWLFLWLLIFFLIYHCSELFWLRVLVLKPIAPCIWCIGLMGSCSNITCIWVTACVLSMVFVKNKLLLAVKKKMMAI